MSKGRVWNKGKHNGGGLSKKAPASQAADSGADNSPAKEADIVRPVPETRGSQVMRMNRENWVERPARVVPKKEAADVKKPGSEE
ncbi:hypothetical protein [Paenibacillus nasutitermitis]|uniref:Uncharacterized protein n=1 Tax=Paenibacillus nasutitermitis TaxID=1652958 RepID=A0A917DP97_9BACL|nr:hypothetical protein [Paenibacillus nasutitermitis]GGD57909.1 hypothetical protein GCM10010911_14630 [Paenibacillus nasutitermitis]